VGPRGGGRQSEAIIQHLLGSDAGYLTQVGWKFRQNNNVDPSTQLEQTRQAILDAFGSSARGGTCWTARYFVRRIAYTRSIMPGRSKIA
jgi:hypothetical protein